MIILCYIESISKILTDLCAITQKIRIKNTFEIVLIELKEACSKMNGEQTVKLKTVSINLFKNHFKQLVLPLKIYADFECLLIGVRGSDRNNNALYTEKNQKYIPCSFPYKVVCVGDRFNKPAVTEEKCNR